jgi:hypothetical protein
MFLLCSLPLKHLCILSDIDLEFVSHSIIRMSNYRHGLKSLINFFSSYPNLCTSIKLSQMNVLMRKNKPMPRNNRINILVDVSESLHRVSITHKLSYDAHEIFVQRTTSWEDSGG